MLFALVAAYYFVHKPFDANLALAVTLDGLRIVLALALIVAAGAAGRRLMGPIPLAPSAQAAVYAAIGLGLAGVVWLLLGASLGLSPWLSWLVLLVTLMALWRSALSWLGTLKSGLAELKPRGGFELGLAAVVAALLGGDLLEALGPPVHFDALVYHLSLPQFFLNAGRFVFDPNNPFWGSPLLVEINDAWAMSLGGASTATVLGVLVGALALLGIFGLTARLASRGAWVAVASLMVGDTLWSSLAWGYVDWYAALFGLAVVVCLDMWIRRRHLSDAVWAGALAGFAMGTKYTAGVVVLAGLAVIWINGTSPDRNRATLGFVGAAVLAFAAWPLKNLIATGAPLYPYLGANPWVSTIQQAFFSDVSSVGFRPVGPLIPLFATIYGVEGAPGYASSIGPLLLGLTLAVLAGPIQRRDSSGLLVVFVVTGWLAWGAANLSSELLGQSRLYMVVFPAWAALAGLGYANLSKIRLGSVRLGRLTQAVVLMTVAFALASALRSFADDNPLLPALGLETRRETLGAPDGRLFGGDGGNWGSSRRRLGGDALGAPRLLLRAPVYFRPLDRSVVQASAVRPRRGCHPAALEDGGAGICPAQPFRHGFRSAGGSKVHARRLDGSRRLARTDGSGPAFWRQLRLVRHPMMSRWHYVSLILVGLAVAALAAVWVRSPGYMDADYYFATARVLASGGGLQVPFLWNYLAIGHLNLPQPAHLYWMPLTTFLAAASMAIFGVTFLAAQVPSLIFAAVLPALAAWMAHRLGASRFQAMLAGGLAILSGFYLPFFVTTDAFSSFAVIGGLALWLMATARGGDARPWVLAGVMSGLGHLDRADGILLVLLAAATWVVTHPRRIRDLLAMWVGYLAVMGGWFVRMWQVAGSPMSPGGLRAAWLTDYNQLFTYPADQLSGSDWIGSGFGPIIQARLAAAGTNLASLLLVNGLVFLTLLMGLGLWRKRQTRPARVLAAYLLAEFAIMTVVFPFPGERGGFFHSSAAAMPLLWALAPFGLESVVDWLHRRRGWDPNQAALRLGFGSLIVAGVATSFPLGNTGDPPSPKGPRLGTGVLVLCEGSRGR